MSVYFHDDTLTLLLGDACEQLCTLDDGSVNCVVTSPPYYGLRDYEGNADQIGLESSPSEYVAALGRVFAEVHRVLADDGTLWLNLGDSYSASPPGRSDHAMRSSTLDSSSAASMLRESVRRAGVDRSKFLPAKNMLGIPWRVAFALQDAGWVLRNAIVWHKPNAMPEPARDRLSNRYEHVFMFSKAGWTGDSVLSLPDVDAAWLAALIDGEGSITIARDRRSEKNPAHQDVFQVCVSIANTCVPLLEKASRLMGGPRVRKNNDGVNRPGYAVQVSGKKAAEVVAAVKPWLIDKLPQADIALALQDTQRAAGVDKASYQSRDGRAYKERLWEAMLAANRRDEQDLAWVRPAKRGRWVSQSYWFDLDPIREPHTEKSRYQQDVARRRPHTPGKAATPGNYSPANQSGFGAGLRELNERGANPGDVWSIATTPLRDAHFAPFPIALPRRCILAGCKPGGTVLDPFSGAGTTAMAAQQLGRRAIGIDINDTYHDIALRRMSDAPLPLVDGEAS